MIPGKFRSRALSCRIVDLYAGLDVIAKSTELDQGILYRSCLHQDSVGKQIVFPKDRSHTVQHMIAGSLYIGQN